MFRHPVLAVTGGEGLAVVNHEFSLIRADSCVVILSLVFGRGIDAMN